MRTGDDAPCLRAAFSLRRRSSSSFRSSSDMTGPPVFRLAPHYRCPAATGKRLRYSVRRGAARVVGQSEAGATVTAGGLAVVVAERLCTAQAPIASRMAMTIAPPIYGALPVSLTCRGG